MISQASDSLLLLVDIQTRLLAAMPADASGAVMRNSSILAKASGLLQIPVLVSEQYPRGLGATADELGNALPAGTRVIEKLCFSCHDSTEIMSALNSSGRKQIILAGVEAHVCVLQTALGLLATGLNVFVVADAICSRASQNAENGLARLRQSGVIVTSTESVLFEWLCRADHGHFKQISALIR